MNADRQRFRVLGLMAIGLGVLAAAEGVFQWLLISSRRYEFAKPLLLYGFDGSLPRRLRFGGVGEWAPVFCSFTCLTLLGIAIGRIAVSYRQHFGLFACVIVLLTHQDCWTIFDESLLPTGVHSLFCLGPSYTWIAPERVLASAALCMGCGILFGKWRPGPQMSTEVENTILTSEPNPDIQPQSLHYAAGELRRDADDSIWRLLLLILLLALLSVMALFVRGPHENWGPTIFSYPWPSVSDGTWTLRNVNFDVALMSEVVLAVMAVLLFPTRRSRWLGLGIMVELMAWDTVIDARDAWGLCSHLAYNLAVIGVSGALTIWIVGWMRRRVRARSEGSSVFVG